VKQKYFSITSYLVLLVFPVFILKRIYELLIADIRTNSCATKYYLDVLTYKTNYTHISILDEDGYRFH